MNFNALLLAGTAALTICGIQAHAGDDDGLGSHGIKHVLLISIDGMHAVDYRNCSQGIQGVNNGHRTRVPNLFGMNFEAVSVGQKLIEKGMGSGGYLDAAGTPSDLLLGEIQFVDASIGKIVEQLKEDGLYDSTLIVIAGPDRPAPLRSTAQTAERQQPGHLAGCGRLYPSLELHLTQPESAPRKMTFSLLWLKDASQTDAAISILEANGSQIGLGTIFYGRPWQ